MEDRKAAPRSLLLDAPCHAMGAEHGHGERRYLRQILDENSAFVLQAFDHVFIVDDLVAHIDRRALLLQRTLDDLRGTHDARAKPARLSPIPLHLPPTTQAVPNSFKTPMPSGYAPISA